MISPLAIPADRLGHRMFDARRRRAAPLYGIMIHTTGSGLPSSVRGDGARALEKAAQIYTGTGGPHYAIGWDGTIVATVADEEIAGAHAGITDASARELYKKGGWESRLSPESVRLWRETWPGASSPLDLVPGRDPGMINDLYIGIEMIPVTDGAATWAKPLGNTRFTAAQHDAARRLAHDIARRHGFPSGWDEPGSTRLVGHSDVNPIQRDSASLPLWDPGYQIGLFRMDRVRGGAGWLLVLGAAAAAGLGTAHYLLND